MNVLKVVLLLMLFAFSNLSAQSYPLTNEGPWRGGAEKTASGTVKVLVVFIRFADDDSSTENWALPDNGVLPSWAQNIVASSVPTGPGAEFTHNTLSEYLSLASGGARGYENSQGGYTLGTLGQLNMIGNVKYVVTNHAKTSVDYEYKGRFD